MNFQNQPNHDERATLLKECVVPKLDTFLGIDYQAFEVRMFAYFVAKQPTIKDFIIAKEFIAGLDPHTETGRMIFGRTPTKPERDQAKRCFLSLMYNGSWMTILRQGICATEDEAKDFVVEFHKARPQVEALTKCTQRIMRDRGYIRTLWGRHLEGPKFSKKKKPIPPWRRPMVNYLIQGSAAEVMMDAMLKAGPFMRRSAMQSHLVLTIHDELLFDALWAEVPVIVENIPWIFGNTMVEQIVPLGTDVAVASPTWADEVEYDRRTDEAFLRHKWA